MHVLAELSVTLLPQAVSQTFLHIYREKWGLTDWHTFLYRHMHTSKMSVQYVIDIEHF